MFETYNGSLTCAWNRYYNGFENFTPYLVWFLLQNKMDELEASTE